MRSNSILTSSICLALLITSCKDEKVNPSFEKLSLVPGSFTAIWPEYRHDGNPVETDNFIIYSEAASQESRQEIGELAELYFKDVQSLLQVDRSDFDFLLSWDPEKIHVMADYNQSNKWGLAYRDGIIIRSKDSPRFDGNHVRWQRVVQHEITHVVEFLLIGSFNYRQANSVWFREGFANYGARNHEVQTLAQLQEWKVLNASLVGGGNPIGVEIWGDFPQSVRDANNTTSWYKFFELSVRYLMDSENGNGTSLQDVKAYYEDLGQGIGYEVAFAKHFKMTSAEFRDNWWALMEDYLAK